MTESIESAVTQLLDHHNIVYDVVTIPLTEDKKPVRNLEERLRSEGRDPTSIIRSLLFRTGSGSFALLATVGGGKADWAALRKQLAERKLTMAEFDEVKQATGYVVGAVPPIALPADVTVLLDDTINNYQHVIIGSGVLGYALSLTSADLKKMMPDVTTGHFTKQ